MVYEKKRRNPRGAHYLEHEEKPKNVVRLFLHQALNRNGGENERGSVKTAAGWPLSRTPSDKKGE